MQPSIKELEEKYNKMRDDQILSLLEDEGMREDAIAILKNIKKKRGIKNKHTTVQKVETKKSIYHKKGRIGRLKYLLNVSTLLLVRLIVTLVISGFIY